MNLAEFNGMVTGSKEKTKVRLRLALLGDALLRLYGVEIGLARWSNSRSGGVMENAGRR